MADPPSPTMPKPHPEEPPTPQNIPRAFLQIAQRRAAVIDLVRCPRGFKVKGKAVRGLVPCLQPFYANYVFSRRQIHSSAPDPTAVARQEAAAAAAKKRWAAAVASGRRGRRKPRRRLAPSTKGKRRGVSLENQLQAWVEAQEAREAQEAQEAQTAGTAEPRLYAPTRCCIQHLQDKRIRLLAAQVTIYNPTLRFATAIDFVGEAPDGRLVLIELKRGFEGHYYGGNGFMAKPLGHWVNSPHMQHQLQLLLMRQTLLQHYGLREKHILPLVLRSTAAFTELLVLEEAVLREWPSVCGRMHAQRHLRTKQLPRVAASVQRTRHAPKRRTPGRTSANRTAARPRKRART